jgi:hypothetical protein
MGVIDPAAATRDGELLGGGADAEPDVSQRGRQ